MEPTVLLSVWGQGDVGSTHIPQKGSQGLVTKVTGGPRKFMLTEKPVNSA